MPLAARSSRVHGATDTRWSSLSLVETKLPHAADEYDEGLQRTPELDSSVVTTTVWQVDSDARYHTRITSNKKSKYHTKRAARKP